MLKKCIENLESMHCNRSPSDCNWKFKNSFRLNKYHWMTLYISSDQKPAITFMIHITMVEDVYTRQGKGKANKCRPCGEWRFLHSPLHNLIKTRRSRMDLKWSNCPASTRPLMWWRVCPPEDAHHSLQNHIRHLIRSFQFKIFHISLVYAILNYY